MRSNPNATNEEIMDVFSPTESLGPTQGQAYIVKGWHKGNSGQFKCIYDKGEFMHEGEKIDRVYITNFKKA